ncbi:unnamed protein product [Phyllotreta striolata]|uniref:Uncharacterized protein n=1 Tax=Phyllotreta striolata TaxID=444603 RepID=A0A9N9TVW5_PHYSR|nr:unnamed protein product [Phyllotreta striolata]
MGDGNCSNCAGTIPFELREMIARNLSKFDGNPEEWLFFKHEFTRRIHDEPSYTPIEKYCFLLKSLEGEALRSVEYTTNYEEAWNSLLMRYDNKGLLTNIHLKAILHDLPHMPEPSPEGLRHIINEIRKNRSCLNILGYPVDHWDTIFIFAVCSRLDSETHRDWRWQNIRDKKSDPTIDDLIDFLQNRERLLEDLRLHERIDVPEIICPVCGDDHLVYSCPEFLELDPRQRFREIKRVQVCSNCLGNDHETKDCSSGGCHKCGRRHHTLLHFS